MKRLLFVLLLACFSGVTSYAVFTRTRPEALRFDCEVKWLSHRLALTPVQMDRMRILHKMYSPAWNGLKAELEKNRGTPKADECREACRASVSRLVSAVSAELTPGQREIYQQLLSSQKGVRKAGAP